MAGMLSGNSDVAGESDRTRGGTGHQGTPLGEDNDVRKDTDALNLGLVIPGKRLQLFTKAVLLPSE